MFKPANSDLRRPAFLQNHTKENAIFQLTLAGAIYGTVALKRKYELRKSEQQTQQIQSESK